MPLKKTVLKPYLGVFGLLIFEYVQFIRFHDKVFLQEIFFCHWFSNDPQVQIV